MLTSTRITALATATVLVAAPLAVATMAPASADTNRNGSCGAGLFEFSVDKQRRGYEIDADIENVKPGSRWTLVIRHDGKRVTKVTRTADNEGEVAVDVNAPNTRGKDTFAFRAKSGSVRCSARVTVA